ncbi:MAG: hypothetical protein II563_04420 [Treponema sp.]|jgi:DNA replication protein DnaD|nr:hypothetical protein [Treponema sp.]MBQ5383888.1 hypothetical protein [Treponema sp.]
MKMIKKIFALASILMLSCVAAFAFDDETAFVELIDTSTTRKDFEAELDDLSNDDIAEMVSEMIGEADLTLAECCKLEADDINDEVLELVDYMQSQIPSNTKKNSVFGAFGINEIDEDAESISGYMIFAHYISKKDISCYVYYFEFQ